ncbi:MAG: hypothetical protein KU37_02260 [Sulfuricurvum sp. PC08-66]|nr:MAG: hypothetical protein KU37_02260 [Sulfuricurvum sp. PC08-66]
MRHLLLTFFLLSSAFSDTFFDRFQTLETQVKALTDQIELLKSSQNSSSAQNNTSELQTRLDQLQLKLSLLEEKLKPTVAPIAPSEPLRPTGEIDAWDEDSVDEENTTLEGTQESAPIDEESAWEETPPAPSIYRGDEATRNELEELAQTLSNDIQALRTQINGQHAKISIDFRTSYNGLFYTMADGTTKSNPALFTNRLWVDLKYKTNDNISFLGQLAYNKHYGARSGTSNDMFKDFSTFDWIANEVAYDDQFRLRQAYFLYIDETFLGMGIPWTFSVGRRPSTQGHLIHFRDDDSASSPLGHAINVEFDGLSMKWSLGKALGIEGMYLKFCAGRGLSNADSSFSATPYATDSAELANIDLAGAIVSLFDNGSFALLAQGYYASNLIGIDAGCESNSSLCTLQTFGDMASATLSTQVNGLFGIPFLDDVTLFASGSASYTLPHANKAMLGSTQSQLGYSAYAGMILPAFSDAGYFGFEYNQGSQYWRSITYAEDTLIGSKIAARGAAYEGYWTEYLIKDIFSMQLRYTYIDYAYTGSNGFFGSLSAPVAITNQANVVQSAQALRFYLRYRY